MMRIAACILSLALGVLPVVSFANLPKQNTNSPSLSPMLHNVMPAVVNIFGKGKITNDEDPFSKPPEERGKDAADAKGKNFVTEGSGVIIDAKHGYVITNAHVITQTQNITVTLSDGRRFKAKPIGEDLQSDVAVLQIEAKDLTAIKFADSGKLSVGDYVVAIGSPFGLNQTVTSGIISALQRNDIGIEGFENFIQTDAPINPGNSGGALVNMSGELVGMNTAILAPSGTNTGIGFAIPSNMVKNVSLQLIKYGELKRGVAGIMLQSLSPELAKAFGETHTTGAIVTQVSPHSPGEKAGLLVGDVITGVDGSQIKTAGQVKNAIGLRRAGSHINLTIVRSGKTLNLKLTTVEPKEYKLSRLNENPFLYGLVLKNFAAQVPNFGQLTGVQVLHLQESSPAWQAGLRMGDVITSANRLPIHSVAEFDKLTEKTKNELLVSIYRGNGAVYLVIKP